MMWQKRRPRLWRGIILLIPALMLAVSIGCSKGNQKESTFDPGKGWASTTRTRIKQVIKEPSRQDAMIALIDDAHENAISLDQEVLSLYEDLARLDRSYDTTPDEFRHAFARLAASKEDHRKVFIGARFKLKDLSTPEEWKRLSALLVNNKSGLYSQTFRKPGQ